MMSGLNRYNPLIVGGPNASATAAATPNIALHGLPFRKQTATHASQMTVIAITIAMSAGSSFVVVVFTTSNENKISHRWR